MKKTFFHLFSISIALLFSLVSCSSLYAQMLNSANSNLVQFTGVVIDAETTMPILYASVGNRRTKRGALCDENGFFSFVVQKGDTVRFSAVGYVTSALVIPTDLVKDSYTVIKKLKRDNIMLPTATIYPWPKPHEFDEAFMTLQVPDDDLKRAKRNLERETLREQGEVLAMDGRENFNYQSRQYARQMYSYGQEPYRGIFDPMAWIKFFKAMKKGELFGPETKRFEIDENYIIDEDGIKE